MHLLAHIISSMCWLFSGKVGGCLSLLETRARANLPLLRRGRSQEYYPSSVLLLPRGGRSQEYCPSSILLFFSDSVGMGGEKDLSCEWDSTLQMELRSLREQNGSRSLCSSSKPRVLRVFSENASSVLLEKWRWSGKWSFTPKLFLYSTSSITYCHFCLFIPLMSFYPYHPMIF